MKKHSITVLAILVTFLLGGLGIYKVYSQDKQEKQDKKEASSLDKSEELAKQYLDAFKKTGIPTPKAVDAAFQKAKTAGTIEAWTEAASMANSYANVIDVLTGHYSDLYYASRSGGDGNYAYISKAADYEKIRNRYLKRRNDAYIELAKLYLAKGDKARALSYAVTAVKLSRAEPNTVGENLIRQIIDYAE
jgi:hypothetical protein